MKLPNRLVVRVLCTVVPPLHFRCNSCEKLIKSANGFTNVMNHLKRFHPNFMAEAETALRDPNLLALRLVDPRTNDIFHWIEWIVVDCLPLSFCKRELTHKNTKLSRISVQTPKKYLDGLVEVVVESVKDVLPDKFGLVLDGWASGGHHYVAIFAVFHDENMQDEAKARSGTEYYDDLECFCPLDREEDMSAQSVFDLIADTLTRFEQSWDAVLFMVGDNCSVNQYIGRREGAIPLIGCASHRFGLAVKDYLAGEEEIINKVHMLMRKLSTVKGRAVLRKVSELAPVMRNETRWSTVYDMMSRYQQLEAPLATLDHGTIAEFDLQHFLLTRSENLKISRLLVHLEAFQSVTAELQRSSLTLSAMRARLAQSAAIVNFPALESGLVKIQRDETLSASERAACAPFRRSTNAEDESKQEDDDPESFATRALKKRKVTRRVDRYMDVGFVPPTSNECERFFSRAKLVYTDLRKSMDRTTLETLMFLNVNRDMWDVYSVETVRTNMGNNEGN